MLHHVAGTHAWAVGDDGTGQCDHEADHADSGIVCSRISCLKRLKKSILEYQALKKDTILFEFSGSLAALSCKSLMLKNHCVGFLNIV